MVGHEGLGVASGANQTSRVSQSFPDSRFEIMASDVHGQERCWTASNSRLLGPIMKLAMDTLSLASLPIGHKRVNVPPGTLEPVQCVRTTTTYRSCAPIALRILSAIRNIVGLLHG